MNTKFIISAAAALLSATTAFADTQTDPDSLTRELQEIVVTAKQPATRLVGTTLVSTIPGSALADLGNALDVLAQLPMMKVSDSEVSVIGKNNIEIYIDGRPLRDSMELQQLLSSDLRKVELLLAPGAAYASTTGAVVRITTRRNFIKGLSVTDQLSIQRRRRWSVMDNLGLTFRKGAWELFVNGTVNRDNTRMHGYTVNTLDYLGKETVVRSSQNNSYPTLTGAVKAGFNYSRNTRSFGAYYRYNPEKGDFTNNGTEWLDSEPPLLRNIASRIRAHSHYATCYYEDTFSDNCLIHFDGDFKSSVADKAVDTTYPSAAASDVASAERKSSVLWAGKLFVSLPLLHGDFTFGTNDSHTRTRLDYRMLSDVVSDYIPSSVTDAVQTSAAVFASWSRMFGPATLSLGARYEYVDYDFKVNGLRDDDLSRRDHTLTPDLSLGYTFSDDAQLSLSYKMTTVKPPYSQLTGSLNYVGLHEIEGGNPALRDERMHDVQLFGMWKDFMIQADYTRSLDSYAFVKQLYPAHNLQLLLHPVNIDVSALSLYLVWSKPIKRWTPNITLGMYRQWLAIDNDRYDTPVFSYYFDNTFALPHGWTITANINGSSAGYMHTNRFEHNWFTMDASVGRTFLGKSLTVKLSATDIFNTANNGWTMRTYGISVAKHQKYDARGISLGIIYNFQPRKSAYKGTSAADAELKRL